MSADPGSHPRVSVPYASSIQVVNDANGTAYAFLADNGVVWQCQWNAQAQLWDKAQPVPLASGGEQLQALYLDKLWPTDAANVPWSNPGIVLAYKLGTGTGAEIHASFGQWTSTGELSWSEPVPLTADVVEEQAFSLVAGEKGEFSLVTQKQAPGQGLTELLTRFNSTPQDELQSELEAAASQQRPDSDLYVSQFKLALPSSTTASTAGSGWELINTTQSGANTTVGPVVIATPPPPVPAAPLALGGNTQLSRQALLTPVFPTTKPNGGSGGVGGMLGATSSGTSNSSSPSTGVSYKGGFGWQDNTKNGGSLRFGLLASQDPMRWRIVLPRTVYTDEGDLRLSSLTDEDSRSSLSDIARDSEKLENGGPVGSFVSAADRPGDELGNLLGLADAGDPPIDGFPGVLTVTRPAGTEANAQLRFFWQGVYGLSNAGQGGPTALSSAKAGIEFANNSRVKLVQKSNNNAGSDPLASGFTPAGGINFGGSLRTTYLYDKGWSARLVGLNAAETISIDLMISRLKRTKEGGSITVELATSPGYSFNQNVSAQNGENLPSWLAAIGYAGGLVGDLEKKIISAGQFKGIYGYRNAGLADNGVYSAGSLSQYKAQANGLRIARGADDDNNWSTLGTAYKLINAGVGTTMAAVGPITARVINNNGGSLNGATFQNSTGAVLFSRGAFRYLYKSLAGIQVAVADQYERFYTGANKGTWQDTFFANAGVALPFGASVSLLSYLHTWKGEAGANKNDTSDTNTLGAADPLSATTTAASTPTVTSTQKGFYRVTPTNGAYTFGYTPSAGTSSYLAPVFNNSSGDSGGSGGSSQALNPYLLDSATEKLLYFTLAAYSGSINPPSVNTTTGSGQAPVTLYNAGNNLKPGTYVDVPLLGVTANGTPSSDALVSFTVPAAGEPYANQIDPSSVKITRGGNYLHLPETIPGSGIYALIPDVYTQGIATPPSAKDGALPNIYADLPLITVDTTKTNPPLTFIQIQRVVSVLVDAASQENTGVLYPNYDSATNTTTVVPANTNTPYTYTDVPVVLQALGSSSPVNVNDQVLNPNALSATVHLSGGVIQRVELNQDLLVVPQPGVTQYNLQLVLPAAVRTAVTSQLPLNEQSNTSVVTAATTPSFGVTTQDVAYNNFVSDEQFSPQAGWSDAGIANAGVYLAAGLSDQLPLYTAMGQGPLQNRVSYVTTTTNAQESVVYLNVLARKETINQATGLPEYSYSQHGSLSSSEWTPQDIYTNPNYVFTLASTPVATTITGAKAGGGDYSGKTLVAWIEASNPVIPLQSSDGTQNYQDYLTALYGNQRINFRIQSGSGWLAPSLSDLYYPNSSGDTNSDPVIIRHLKAFNVAKPGAIGTNASYSDDQIGTLLVWSESSVAAIQGMVEELGSGQSVPTVLKTAWINPDATSLEWTDLTNDANGQSTIQTIQWDPTTDVGLTLDNISIASMPVLQSDGTVAQAPVISWSQNVRTPYRQSVLEDQPLVYLQLGELQSGLNNVNLGSISDPSSTATSASETGLNFAIAGALPLSSASAVQNVDGTGVLSTGLGTSYASISNVLNNIPASSLSSGDSAIARFTGSIANDVLTVSAISAGSLAVGDLISAAGVAAGTRIKALLDTNASGIGTYAIETPQAALIAKTSPIVSSSQTVSSSAMEAIPATANGVMALFSGSISGNTLTVSSVVQGALQLGDVVVGEGVPVGTTITAVGAGNTGGSGTYTLSTTLNQPLAASSLAAIPGQPTTPYTLEFWVQLPAATQDNPTPNPNGAGLVAFGQPSTAAVGAATLPQDWLLSSSFVVDRVTYAQASAQGSDEASAAIANGSVDGSAFFGWAWGLVAQGASTTATDGTGGGSNLYSNALQITNLQSGAIAQGMNQFLSNYQLTSADLPGIDGTNASTMAMVPTTQLQFDHSLDSNNQPVSILNGIAVDTTTSILNRGLITASALTTSANSAQLSSMFQALWDFQQKTGEAKVNLSLPQNSGAVTTVSNGALPSAMTTEQYQGYGLTFALQNGPAVSVNGAGQLVFDVGNNTSITSSLPQSLNDGKWHYVVASYLPTYQAYAADGTLTQLPTNVGTASLYIDNQLAAPSITTIDAFAPSNLSDQALLLANNVGGAIDQFAFYDKALSTSTFQPNSSGNWPQPNADDALAVLAAMGYGISTKTPDPGAIPGAVSAHWAARNVNPNNAELATFYSTLAGDSWTPVSNLNPSLAVQPSTTSASRPGSIQNDLVIQVPAASWLSPDWTVSGVGAKSFFNPTGESGVRARQLSSIAVTLTDSSDSSNSKTVTLRPDQVLIGEQTLQTLQPLATSTNYQYSVLNNAPVFQLLIGKDQLPTQSKSVNANYTFTFTDYNTATNNNQRTTTVTVTPTAGSVLVNVDRAELLTSEQLGYANTQQRKDAQSYGNAIATAAVIEQAPLQLKYIDSGEMFKSAATAAAANSPSTSQPAESFGQSQVYGYFGESGGIQSGWLAIAQPSSRNATSDPAGRIWINYTGQFTISTNTAGETVHTAVETPAQAPITWLNALANSNFSPDAPTLPLANDPLYRSTTGGLLIQADPTAGWDQNIGQTMLVADINQDGDGIQDLVLAAPQANGGGLVYIIDGTWIQNNLTTNNGATILNLANPDALGNYVTVLAPSAVTASTDNIDVAGFGTALAFDENSGQLLIGAPNYLRQFSTTGTSATELQALQPIGAVYSYNASNQGNWGTGKLTQLSNPILGTGGQLTTLGSDNQPITSFWGSQLGTAIAVDGNGGFAVSAPGVVAAMEYSGTKAVQESAVDGKKRPADVAGDGALIKIGLPALADGTNLYNISSTGGTKNSNLIDIVNQTTTGTGKHQTNPNASGESQYMQQLKALQTDYIADATLQYNQALQANAVGAVYLLNSAANFNTLATGSATSGLDAAAVKGAGGATFYGAQPWNTLGASGFGSSLAFGDLNNRNNSGAVLAIGAAQTGGPGALYLFDGSQHFAAPGSTGWLNAINLGDNEYLAHLASGLTLYGAESQDNFANGVINLGDVNQDFYNDLGIQAFNSSSGAGNGYVLFGLDKIFDYTTSKNADGSTITVPNPAVGSVSVGGMGRFSRADGSTFQAAIMSQLGSGPSGYTGQGTFGPGDVNADGKNDILLGSGNNGSAYLTWGHDYLESIKNLELSKLSSDTGYMLDGLASATAGSLQAIGDFNGDGYGDFISISPGSALDTVRIELGANTQEILADYPYNFYSFTVAKGTEVIASGDLNGDGMDDLALFLEQNLSTTAQGNQGAGSTTGILYGRSSNQLPIGSGFGLLAPVDPESNAPLTTLPGVNVAGGLTTAPPAFINVGNTIYGVVQGYGDDDSSLWFAQSNDGGNSWSSWTNLSASNAAFAANPGATQLGTGASLCFFNNTLYLAFVTTSGSLALSSWDPSSNQPGSWSNPVVLSGFSSAYSPELINRGDALGMVWVDATSSTLYGANATLSDLEQGIWSPASQLQQRSINNGVTNYAPITATSAPSASYLAAEPVLAVNNAGSINVYAGLPGGVSWQLASSFAASSGDSPIAAAPALAATDTGLALTYTSSNGAINLQRLDLLSLDGAAKDGVQFNTDGGFTVANADLLWQSTLLDSTNSGLSTALPSVPLSVEGNLLLANVRNSANQSDQIWLNAVPNASDPNSTTWLNSTVQLPNKQGGWSISQQAGSGVITPFAPTWINANGANGQSTKAPSFAQLNGVVYAAVQGTDNLIWINASTNGGASWQTSWTALPSTWTTYNAPSLAVFGDSLYLCYLGENNNEINITSIASPNSDLSGFSNSANWSDLYQISGQSANFATLTTETVGNTQQLAVYYVANNTTGTLLKTYTTTPTVSSSWSSNTAIQYPSDGSLNAGLQTQTASGPLAVTQVGSQTYIAYQGGTTASGDSSNTIYLTTTATPNNSKSWRFVEGIPQASSGAHTGVGLTSDGSNLILSYADQSNAAQVLQLQRGTVSDNVWSGLLYNTITAPGGANTAATASLFASNGSAQVLVGGVNPNSSVKANAIVSTLVSPLPASAALTAAQSGSNLTAVGDLNGDGYGDLLVAANHVVATSTDGQQQLATGLRLITGAPTSSAISQANDSTNTKQTVYLAPNSTLSSHAPVASVSGSAQLTIQSLTQQSNGRGLLQSTEIQLPATLPQAIAGELASAQLNAAPAPLQSAQPLEFARSWGTQAYSTNRSYGDLNGDGRLDFFNPAGNLAIDTGDGGVSLSLWSIQAAGDVNGNGVDDVLLALTPNGPSYFNNTTGGPNAIQSVLIDGSLFKVDPTTNSFRLDQLYRPLDPFNRGESYDVSATSPSQYSPLLQNWFEPIQTFQPGSLTAASTANGFNPASAESMSPPSPAVDADGQIYLLYSGNSFKSSGSGLWMAYQNKDGSWSQLNLPVGSDACNYSPSAVFYDDVLYVAYSDVNGYVHIAYSSTPEVASSWNSYQVITAGNVDEKTAYSPTLVVEQGRLALYFPAAAAAANNGSIAALAQNLRYLYSRDPQSSSGWGSSVDTATGQFSGVSGVMNVVSGSGSSATTTQAVVSSSVAATRFQGKTVLASNTGSGTVQLFTAPSANPEADAAWLAYDTSITTANGIGLATDQALLYLTVSTWGSTNPKEWTNATPQIWSATPSDSQGQWSLANSQTISGPGLPAAVYLTASGGDGEGWQTALPPNTVQPFFVKGNLYATWAGGYGSNVGGDFDVQLAQLSTTIAEPSKQSLAGYALGGGIDNNGDGFSDVLISDPSDPSLGLDNQYILFGGDYLDIASQVGTGGNDTLIGTPLADVLYTIGGSDVVQSNGGPDVIYTGSGDDQISIINNAFLRIDAGSGFDQLLLTGLAGQSYDFRLNVPAPQYFSGTKMRNIELISSIDYGSNELYFDAKAVNAINPDRILFLTPDSDDQIKLSSEFKPNSAFNTSYQGVLWNAYAAGIQSSPADAKPTLIYVRQPDGTDPTWLSTNVTSTETHSSTANSSTPAPTLPAAAAPVIPTASTIASRFDLGNGATLVGYKSTTNSQVARFSIERTSAATRQVFAYNSTTTDSRNADLGSDYDAIAGLLVLEQGQTSKDITIPISSRKMELRRDAAISLQLRELANQGQRELHLVVRTQADNSSPQAPTPVLSDFSLTPNSNGDGATLVFRADVNTSTDNRDTLGLVIQQRLAANTTASSASRVISLLDAIPTTGTPPAYNSSQGAFALDHDQRNNGQVSAQLELNFSATNGQISVSLAAPELNWDTPIQLVGTASLQFQQNLPLTSWRSDHRSGAVSFGFQDAANPQNTLMLLRDALGGNSGSITPQTATLGRDWLASEGKAIGGISTAQGLQLTGTTWIPTAFRDGQALELLNLRQDGGQITATFTDGITGIFSQQATGNAPSPIRPSLELSRLGRNNNAFGLYEIDNLTGTVDGLAPGDPNYLRRALDRSQSSGLYLDPTRLPAFGATTTYNDLPIDPNKNYGLLLAVNGDPSNLFSSFSNANPNRSTQMVSLGTSRSGFTAGIEDQSLAANSDRDFNDLQVTLNNVLVPLF